MKKTVKITGISGSLREESFNRKLLEAAHKHASEHIHLNIYSLADIPLYNADLESDGDPEAVTDFKRVLDESDGLWIVTPEYHHGIPGVLKNALDWAGSDSNYNALKKVPAAVVGASPTILGTAYAQLQVKQTLAAAGSIVMQQPEVFITRVNKKLDAEGKISDPKIIKRLEKSLDAFYEWIQKTAES